MTDCLLLAWMDEPSCRLIGGVLVGLVCYGVFRLSYDFHNLVEKLLFKPNKRENHKKLKTFLKKQK